MNTVCRHVKADEDVFGKGAKFRLPELAALSDHLGRKAMAMAASFRVLRGGTGEGRDASAFL